VLTNIFLATKTTANAKVTQTMMMRNSNVVSRTFDQADVSKKFRDKPWADHLEYAKV
jgi:hypothetical protein